MLFRLPWFALACATVLRGAAQPFTVAEAEALHPPTAARLASIHAAAQRDGWAAQRPMLRAVAMAAYEKEKLSAAEAWFNVFRWAALFGELAVSEFGARWIEAVNREQVGHRNMAARASIENRPLGQWLSPELQAWLIGNAAVTDEFFSIAAPVDYLPKVFEILNELHRRDPAKFKTYVNLALAIALVYDVPPPPVWPHGQVPEAVLPRKFPPAADAFAWWIKQDQQGRCFHRLSRLGADELKFVVDAAAPFRELEWAQNTLTQPLNELPRAYSMVRYHQERAANGIAVWPGRTYHLAEILKIGGICADQAYFATQVGKARGVPTLLFYGAGNDGRHAWFGFLDANQQWQLDAGRYAEQRYVTGLARDPQTWSEFSDHELRFLTERFRNLPSYRQSRAHTGFAAEYLEAGDATKASAAARKAVNYERRNRLGWEILILATQRQTTDPKRVEAVMREAALAFQRYPDLEAFYVNRVSESLRARGQTSAADAELRRIAHKHENGRTDLRIQQARVIMERAMQSQPVAEQMRTYFSTLESMGRGAGIAFFDKVVEPFVSHLLQRNQRGEANRAVQRARETLRVEPNSQLQAEFALLEQKVRNAN